MIRLSLLYRSIAQFLAVVGCTQQYIFVSATGAAWSFEIIFAWKGSQTMGGESWRLNFVIPIIFMIIFIKILIIVIIWDNFCMKGLAADNGRRELAWRDEANLILNFVIPMRQRVVVDIHHQERAAYRESHHCDHLYPRGWPGQDNGEGETRWKSPFSTRVLILSEKSTQFTFIHFRLGIFIAEHSNDQHCISLQEPLILCPQILAKISLEFFTLHWQSRYLGTLGCHRGLS